MNVSSGWRTKKARYEVEALECRRLMSASMLKDINATTNGSVYGTTDAYMVEMGGRAYFAATDAIHGQELWKSDGTSGGTMMVKDIVPGAGDSTLRWLTTVGNSVYFAVYNAAKNYELWKTDGSDAGTVFIKQLGTLPSGSTNPYQFTAIGNTLFFIDTDAASGTELWRSDGTAGGTVVVRDITPGSGSSSPSLLTAVGSTLFFRTTQGAMNYDLWKSDGTAGGTVLVKSWSEGQWSSIVSLTGVNDTLYFTYAPVGQPDYYRSYLAKSDGTAAGTVTIPTSGIQMYRLINAGGTLYFVGYTSNNSYLFKVNADGQAQQVTSSNSSQVAALSSAGHYVYYQNYVSSYSYSLWRSDGTTAGTTRLATFQLTPANLTYRVLDSETSVGNTLFFVGDDGTHGRELWKSDGTVSGTVMVKDIIPDNLAGDPQALTAVNGKLYFFAQDLAAGREVWTSDGTEAGTARVGDINTVTASGAGPDRTVPGSVDPVSLNGVTYFPANDGFHGTELWRSDGTAAGTLLVKDIAPGPYGSNPVYLRNIGGTIYFVALSYFGGPGNLASLWKSDGTAEGTVMIKYYFHDQPDGAQSAAEGPPLISWHGNLFFYSYDEATQYNIELWKTDGTAEGTIRVKDIRPGYRDSIDHTPFAATNEAVYFLANDGVHGLELWKSDGTDNGTVLVADIAPGTNSYFATWPPKSAMYAVGNNLFFTLDDGVHGTELWKTNGTAGGTILLNDIAPGSASSFPSQMTNLNGVLYFAASSPSLGSELWQSDGTPEGTVPVKDIVPGTVGSSPGSFATLNGGLIFRAAGPEGIGLWRSDGTAQGTALVKAVGAILVNSTTGRGITVVGDTAYFQTNAGLWRTDGTTDGTWKVPSGSLNAIAAGLAAAGDTLYFRASDPLHGTEWWTVQNDPPGMTATPDSAYTFTGPADHKTLAVTAGTVTLAADLSAAYPSLSITVSGTGAVAINAPQHLAALTLDGPGASVTFGGTSDLAGLSFAGGRSLVTVPVESPAPAPAPPRLSVGDVAKAEGDAGVTLFTFPVTLDRASDSIVKVYYATANQTAAKGSDYLAGGGVLTFKPGETRKTVTVQVKGDKTTEADEAFRVVLYNPAGATIGDGIGVGTIRNDDAPAKPRAGVGDAFVVEGNAGTRAVTFNVTLDHAAVAAVTLQYATADGTAKAGSDYLAAAGAVTFKPGETRKRVTVYVKGDKTKEANETLFLNLLAPVNAALADRQGRAVIRNDDK